MTARQRAARLTIAMGVTLVAVGCTSVSGPQAPSGTISPIVTPSPTSVAPTTSAPATPTTSAPSTAAPATPTTVAPTTPAPTTPAPTTAVPTTAAPSSNFLREGDSGPAVAALQQRLLSLRYWLGSADGKFGDATQQAVVAFQKAAGLERDGVVGPRTTAALRVAVAPQARPAQTRTIEIDLRRQLLFLVDGQVTWVFNTSTGGGYVYYQDGRRHVAVTPVGDFKVTRQIDGWDRSPLGMLWRPKYFNGGIAVHGYGEVPAYPASHGCVRVSIEAMNWLWTTGAIPIGTPVVVY